MTTYLQTVPPRTGVTDGAGWCLRFTQTVFAAPVAHPSAKAAANATQFRHATREMPNVAVPVWFDHWGTYGGVYANWGHVVAWVPGHGFLSSPGAGHGQQWFPTILAVERAFNAKFLFWSEDINTLRVAKPAASPTPHGQEDGEMQSISVAGKHIFGVNNEFITHYADMKQADITRKVTSSTDELHRLTVAQFNDLLDGLGIPREVVQDGTVFNPQTGKFERNGTWSRGREILAKLGVK